MWWLISVIPAAYTLRREDRQEFEATLHFEFQASLFRSVQTLPDSKH